MEATMGLDEVTNWWGRSLWDCEGQLPDERLCRAAYQIDFALPAFFYAQYKRLFQARGGFSQREECLMWPSRGLAVDGREK
jgi:hypothetical protein